MRKSTLVTWIFCLSSLGAVAAVNSISLEGQWRFQLDRGDVGIKERWCENDLRENIRLPGTLPGHGIGDPVSVDTKWIGGIVDRSWFIEPGYEKYRQPGNVKVPFWLTPETYYAGAAWYQRDINLPEAWSGKRVVLSLERPHWETRVWVDDKFIGANTSLATAHDYDLGRLTAGKHKLTIRVDNRMVVDIGENSHSVSDHTQGNWNGIVGKIELRATPLVWLEDVQIDPDLAAKGVRVKARVGNSTGQAVKLVAEAEMRAAKSAAAKFPVRRVEADVKPGGSMVEFNYDLSDRAADCRAWDEFNPALYDFSLALQNSAGGSASDAKTVRFGFREISTEGTQFILNGNKLFIRGTLDCCIYPKTGHPPTDVDSWKRVIKICKAHGLNNIRFHSWCPPEAAFIAADELGFYLHVEASSWANQSTTLGDGKPVDQWIYDETDRIIKYYGNHPSFLLMPFGNEPGGKNHAEYLAKWVSKYKAQDPRRLWTSGAGWPQLPENQFHVTPDPRIQAWGEGLKSRINANPPETVTDYRDYIHKRAVPVISHEIGQWCVYPNFDETRKYTGYLKARNFEIFRESLNAHHMGDLARKFLLASGKLQTLCYKEDIESALRTPGMGGFQLLDLHDFPGQGTALVGVLDPFWESKGYVTAEEYSRFCNSTVPLARMAKRVFTKSEKLEAELELAHFGPAPLRGAFLEWQLLAPSSPPSPSGERGERMQRILASGRTNPKTVPIDNCISMGRVSIDLSKFAAPARYKLVAKLESENRANDWDVWVYPSEVSTEFPRGIVTTSDLDEKALAALNSGGKVLLTIPPERVAPDKKLGKVALGFSSIFWNTAWTRNQAPHTLGVLVEPAHPLFAAFPTEYHSNWQWWYLVSKSGAMIMDEFDPELRPTVQVIDDWVTNRKLGLVFEGKVGSGKLMVCSIDLENGLEDDPVRRQFRHSLLQYMDSSKFDPPCTVTADQVRGLFKQVSAAQMPGLQNVTADSDDTGNEPENAVDGNPDTLWHTAWRNGATPFPHHLKLEFKTPKRIRGFTALPRQDNRNGWICDYTFYASNDGQNWGQPVKRGSFDATRDLKTVTFDKPVSGRFFMLVATAGFSGQYASLAELKLIEAGPEDSAGITRSHTRIAIDRNGPGLTFDGVGGVSAGGSTRLLIDYPEPERSQVLDYLFKPGYGASLQMLKVEIGADTDSTCGAEPSHQRVPGEIDCDRGYEWWLMKEATARNPEIRLGALAWGAPGWIQGGFWSDDTIRYILTWMDCSKKKGCESISWAAGTSVAGTPLIT